MKKEVILTGIRANSDLHIGHYFGALLPLIKTIKKSENYQVNLFVPDLHSFTTPIDHGSLKKNIIENLKGYLASGLDINNENVYLYRQSYIPAHSEMTWILDCFTGIGEMNRMTQFKDKSGDLQEDRISVGLFHYPVLMAADILLYDAQYIPVGEDQYQHIEFTRDIAARFNNRFGQVFNLPKPIKEQNDFFQQIKGLRLRNLITPDKKMSKSSQNRNGIIFLNDNPNDAYNKIMSATTDNLKHIDYDYKVRPGVSNLLDIYQLLGGDKKDFIGRTNYKDLKLAVALQIKTFIIDFQKKYSLIDGDIIKNKLAKSEAAMNVQANKKLYQVQKAVGLR